MSQHENLTVVARMRAKTGKEQQLREALAALVPPTLREPGCVTYDLHVEVEDPASFCLYEVWTGRPEHAANLETPHLRDFAARLDDLVEGELQVSFLTRVPVRPYAVPGSNHDAGLLGPGPTR